LDAETDRAAYEEALREAESIIRAATPVDQGSPNSKSVRGRKSGRRAYVSKPSPSASGFCIRCGTGTDYDTAKPYCGKCFRQWLRFKSPAYADDRCHGCGAENEKAFSLEKPECYPCYKRNAKAAMA
ncbi:hypothetical protein RM540_06085, partial [Rubrivirga sp. F394]